jgi:hypothetical protein
VPAGADFGFGIKRLISGAGQLSHHFFYIRHFTANMMDAFAALFYEFADGFFAG